MHTRPNIVLIGMPGSGKSSVGVILAKQAARGFIDTDVLIQVSAGRSLQEIVDRDGHMALRRIEEEIVLGLACHNHVIATGGSAVYSHKSVNHLKSNGIVVFLHADIATLQARVEDFSVRGLAKHPNQSFADLFVERLPLYMQAADLITDCTALTHEEVCTSILAGLAAQKKPGKTCGIPSVP